VSDPRHFGPGVVDNALCTRVYLTARAIRVGSECTFNGMEPTALASPVFAAIVQGRLGTFRSCRSSYRPIRSGT
jgi:hypothetical protein